MIVRTEMMQYSQLGSPAQFGIGYAICPDLNNEIFFSDGARWRPVAGILVLAQSAVPVPLTGSTGLTTLATVNVPANIMGLNGRLRIATIWSCTNNANNKTPSISFAGASLLSSALTTVNALMDEQIIANRGAANSQIALSPSTIADFGSSGNANVTTAIDTTQNQQILIQGQLANAGDTLQLESYLVEVLYG